MVSDYNAIRIENEKKYGTDIGRIGPMLLANRYDDRTHFIFELLQNAEDALARRQGWDGRRAVGFELSNQALRVSHYGIPFTEGDVCGICGIGESTKDLTSIGRFGIGFKSVYAFTDCPEIYSGDERFSIESFVWPKVIPPIETEPGQTVLRLPLRDGGQSAIAEIASGLQRLGHRTLLFLREIEGISWTVSDGSSGRYLRDTPQVLGKNARKVTVIGEGRTSNGVVEETWLVFSREVSSPGGTKVGYAELAFRLQKSESDGELSVSPVRNSPLIVFFPTILQTNLGFLVQGPYRTTPSRDNVPANDPWNKHLVTETAALLVEALQELRGLNLLNVDALRSLPLDASRFPEGSMFAPLFTAVREALSTLPLLPRFRAGHIAAMQAKLARTQELRELFSPSQLSILFQVDQELAWLNEEITQDRTPELRRYLMDELDIAEMAPEALPSRLTKSFLEAQTDEWTVQLYEFLHRQPALLRAGRLNDVPLIRLENGNHVTPWKGGEPQAFLPGLVPTGFPTVRRSVCRSEEALGFLRSLKLSHPDPVDDVIANVLPKYQRDDDVQVTGSQHQADIDRLLTAFSTDSTTQRNKLIGALRNVRFVVAVNTGNSTRHFVLPRVAYQATQRLKDLFQGVPDVFIVDDTYECLRREKVRDLLEACGTALYLQPIETEPSFTWDQKAEMRTKSGTQDISYEVGVQDFILRGLEPLLATLSHLPPSQAGARAVLLWQALCDVQDRRGTSTFSGTYKWFYYHQRQHNFDAAFVRLLNESAWVPDCDGVLQRPGVVIFADMQPPWDHNPFLLSKIRFKPPIIDELAKEAGIEPGVLDLLKKMGLTSEAGLRERLRIQEEVAPGNGRVPSEIQEEGVGKPPGTQPAPPVPHSSEEPVSAGGNVVEDQAPQPKTPISGPKGSGSDATVPDVGPYGRGPSGKQPQTSQQHAGTRKFISYVAVNADEEDPDPDGLDHQERLGLEEKATALVLSHEPQLKRMPTNNPGFDLMQPGPDGNPVKLVEIKAMTGTLQNRPVGLSKRQFECAQEHGESYWLYVVEHAGSSEQARIVRVQDPAGKAHTFTFDHGWLAVSETSSGSTSPG